MSAAPFRYLLGMNPGHALRPLVAVLACALLCACGQTVKIQGTADEAWNDTIEVLKLQGVYPAKIVPGKERPRVDRAKGEIDLLYARSVYYGEGAAFIQVDVDHPNRNLARTVRMWVDFPVGNRVVRYGRALDEGMTDQFSREFTAALAKFRERQPERAPPTPEEEAAQEAAEEAAEEASEKAAERAAETPRTERNP